MWQCVQAERCLQSNFGSGIAGPGGDGCGQSMQVEFGGDQQRLSADCGGSVLQQSGDAVVEQVAGGGIGASQCTEAAEGLQSGVWGGGIEQEFVQQRGSGWVLLLKQQSCGGFAVPCIGVFEECDKFVRCGL